MGWTKAGRVAVLGTEETYRQSSNGATMKDVLRVIGCRGIHPRELTPEGEASHESMKHEEQTAVTLNATAVTQP